MGRIIARPALWIAGLALILAACGGDAAPTTTAATTTTLAPSTTTTTEIVVTTTTAPPTTTTTTLPSGPPIAEEGDHNEIVEAVQSLLNCNGFGDLEVDGSFGPATLAAVEAAQEGLGREVTGAPDDELLAALVAHLRRDPPARSRRRGHRRGQCRPRRPRDVLHRPAVVHHAGRHHQPRRRGHRDPDRRRRGGGRAPGGDDDLGHRDRPGVPRWKSARKTGP